MPTATLTVGLHDVGDVVITYDVATLTAQTIEYSNPIGQDVAVLLYLNGKLMQDGQSPANATRVIAAGTPLTALDVSAFKLPLRVTGGVPSLPSGVSIGVRIPA